LFFACDKALTRNDASKGNIGNHKKEARGFKMKPARLVTAIAALLTTAVGIAGDNANPFDIKLAADKQPHHVLNRMAYGPRPGDVEAVRRMGVKEWIRQQLDPAHVPENPALNARLEGLLTLNFATWQLLELTQQPQMNVSMMTTNITQLVPVDKLSRLSSALTPVEERTEILKALTPDVRSQVLMQIPQQVVDTIPEYRKEAEQARQNRQEMISRQVTEQQRKLRPPLSELFTPDQLSILRNGTDEQKTALIEPLNEEKRSQVFRSMGPQGVTLLPATFRRQGMLIANPQQGGVNELIDAKLQRAVLSNRQLQEVLVDFWFNHFNVSITKQMGPMGVRNLLPSYERDAIRPHVLGKFRDMLLATARHPAMLYYLDNYQSQAPRPELLQSVALGAANIRLPGINENYGREIMELHTLGVGGGYTQEDVTNVARVLTGWSIFDLNRVGEFQFNPQYHDRNEKKVLGKVFPRGGGESEGVQVIDMLARHPSTARFISRKLAQRFVADEPPSALVDRMAETFIKTDGDLRAVMETLLLSKEFLSEGAWRSKIKSPLEMVASSLRATNADVTESAALAKRIAELGQPLYAKAEPTGYPNTSDMWSNSIGLLGRMNFASALFAGQIDGIKVDAAPLAAPGLRKAMLALTGIDASAETIAAVEKGAGGKDPAPAFIATALIGSPDFQKK
jgi:uncharacterized protein (DUF1800 family)